MQRFSFIFFFLLQTGLLETIKYLFLNFKQGLKSTTDEKGASALQTINLDEKFGGEALQVGGT